MERNSVSIFHSIRIKRYILFLILAILWVCITSFILKESIKHILWVKDGILEGYPINLNAIFYTVLFVDIFLTIGAIAYFIYVVIIIIKSIQMLKYYKTAVITNQQRVLLDFDYKLWQTAKKGTFLAMPLTIRIDGVEQALLSDKIFTNNDRIGFVKIPSILRSQSYVKDFCIIGYDEKRKMPVILSVEKE